MKKYTEEELRQIFKNKSNCYADSDEVIMAMDEDRFIEVLKELKILPIQRVSQRSELKPQFNKPMWQCDECDTWFDPKETELKCPNCGFCG